jgi:hypothetical protein
MPELHAALPSNKSMVLLSRLLLSHGDSHRSSSRRLTLPGAEPGTINREDFDRLVALAGSNHVIVRGMEIFAVRMRDAEDSARAGWAEDALAKERERIQNAIPFLHSICVALEEEGHDAIVIKSLDHWPDLGSDLDLYTSADPTGVVALMRRRFDARLAERSWGDRLARKWNFLIPGLPEAVEIHMGRLGQTGEQRALASSVVQRGRRIQIDGYTFRVPHSSDRLLISALQRMYRHFYFRLCDIVDSAGLVEQGGVNYEDLEQSARAAGIWEGMATYLLIVSDYVAQYRVWGLGLPESVRAAARFGGEKVYFARDFLRVPILPQSTRLYGLQLSGLLRRRELQSSVRLGLLPWLATAAALGQKITGSDKGIW